MSTRTIPLNVLADIARYTAGTIQGQQDFLRNLKNPPSDKQLAAILAYQKTEAAKIPGIWQEVSQRATHIPADRKNGWIERKVCRLLEEGADVFNYKEEEAAGPDIRTLTPFQQVKLGNIIAKKKASILVDFFKRLKDFPEATALLEESKDLPEIKRAEAIRQWMHENPELLDTKNLTDLSELDFLFFFPEEVLLFPNIAPLVLQRILHRSCQYNIGLFRKIVQDARFQDIAPDALGEIFTSVWFPRQGVVDALIGCSRFQDIPPASIAQGFERACHRNYPKIVHALIHCGRFSEISTGTIETYIHLPKLNNQIKDLLQEQLNKRQQEEQKSS
jgi:hypothetical protein